LAALDDQRLAEARRHFETALIDLRQDDAPDAIDKARLAVEGAMIAVLQQHGEEVPRRQPQQLFDALTDAEIVPEYATALVLGAPRFRGPTEAAHAGGVPVDLRDAEAVIGSAAAAITYLSKQLR
jgi:HEPN domain-containing protein